MTRVPRRILLVGAGYVGRVVAEQLARQRDHIELVGILDDDPDKLGVRLAGADVVGNIDQLEYIVQQQSAEEVVIAIPSLGGSRLRDVVASSHRAGVALRTMPGILELLGGPITSNLLRPVAAGDLLRRAEISCDTPPPLHLTGARVLVTGAGGSIGRELCRQVARACPASLILLGRGENSIHDVSTSMTADAPHVPMVPVIADIRDPTSLSHVFARWRPEVVFHAAAHKHVPLMQSHPSEAVRNNVIGTRHLVRAALEHNVQRFVLISSDKAVAPSSIMGATKRLCEWIVTDAADASGRAFVTVRFGNVLGSRGSVVPALERQIANGGPVRLTHPEMQRFFMTIQEAVYLVLRASATGLPGDLLVLEMGPPLKIVDLARDMIRIAGLSADRVPVIYTGLRPGEKLVEALWEEQSVRHLVGDGLLRVVEPALLPTASDVSAIIEGLSAAAAAADEAAVTNLLATVMPTLAEHLAYGLDGGCS